MIIIIIVVLQFNVILIGELKKKKQIKQQMKIYFLKLIIDLAFVMVTANLSKFRLYSYLKEGSLSFHLLKSFVFICHLFSHDF